MQFTCSPLYLSPMPINVREHASISSPSTFPVQVHPNSRDYLCASHLPLTHISPAFFTAAPLTSHMPFCSFAQACVPMNVLKYRNMCSEHCLEMASARAALGTLPRGECAHHRCDASPPGPHSRQYQAGIFNTLYSRRPRCLAGHSFPQLPAHGG